MSASMTWQAWMELLYVDYVGRRGFRALKELVLATPTLDLPAPPPATIEAVVRGMESASRRYLKRPMCLQRSIVVTRLLRRRGVRADLVVGCHMAPLRAHAWVEVAGDVVSDKLEDLPYFSILDRW